MGASVYYMYTYIINKLYTYIINKYNYYLLLINYNIIYYMYK